MTFKIDIGADEEIIARAHYIRRIVFIGEQEIVEEEEWDDLDDKSIHFLIVENDTDIGTGRLQRVGDLAKLQRIAVIKSARGKNAGHDLVRAMVDYARHDKSFVQAYLSAQCYAIPFYEKFGFQAYGDVYDDAGIPHRDMKMML